MNEWNSFKWPYACAYRRPWQRAVCPCLTTLPWWTLNQRPASTCYMWATMMSAPLWSRSTATAAAVPRSALTSTGTSRRAGTHTWTDHCPHRLFILYLHIGRKIGLIMVFFLLTSKRHSVCSVDSFLVLQPPGAREGGAHRDRGGWSASVPPGWCHTQPAIAERRPRPGGGSSHRGAGVGQIRDGPEGRDIVRSIPPSPFYQCQEEMIATLQQKERREKKRMFCFC